MGLSTMKSSMIIPCFLVLKTIATFDFTTDADVFFGKESFMEDTYSFAYARCEKPNETFEKVCYIRRYANIFDEDNMSTSMACPAILESKRHNTVVGSNIKILPFGDTKVIVEWIEKYEGDSTPRDVFIELTVIKAGNCSKKDVEFSLPLMIDENPDDSLERVHVFTNDAKDYFIAAFYNENLCGKSICRMSFDGEGNAIKGLEPWFQLKDGMIRELIPLKRGYTDFGFLAFSDLLEAYLVDESGSQIRKLDIYSDADSKAIYSTDHDSISFCYYVDSSFSCARFTHDGELKMKRRLKLSWKIVSSFVHYLPNFGLILITDTDSELCRDDEIKQYITFITDDGKVVSRDFDCRTKYFTDLPQFYHKGTDLHCLLRVNLTATVYGAKLVPHSRCFPSAELVLRQATEKVASESIQTSFNM